MWDPEAIAKAVLTIGTPLLTLIGVGSRKRRLRNTIKENLALIDEIEKHDVLRNHTLASGWLQGRIALDVARLADQKLGTSKAPIPKGSVIVAGLLAAGFGFWAYWINQSDFLWYSVFPGVVAFLMLISILGMVTNRELPPDEAGTLPPGAVRAPTETESERIATRVALAASGGVNDRAEAGGQVDTVFKFVQLLQEGEYEIAIALADEQWILCRVQSWLWNNRDKFGEDTTLLDSLAGKMLSDRQNDKAWQEFVASETNQFVDAWRSIDFNQYGFAGRRQRLARDADLVILLPVGKAGGYFVMTATAVPNAMSFVVVRRDGKWKVANHVGAAPAVPGWPPAWWSFGDPSIEMLPD